MGRDDLFHVTSLTSLYGCGATHRFATPLRLNRRCKAMVSPGRDGPPHRCRAAVTGRFCSKVLVDDGSTRRGGWIGPGRPAIWLGLSGKLLILTIVFVMMAEVLIFVPSIATFRRDWLNDKLSAAYTAALVLQAAPDAMVPDSLARQVLDSIGARAVAMKMGTQRRLLAVSGTPPTVDYTIDMRDMSLTREILDAFRTLVSITAPSRCA